MKIYVVICDEYYDVVETNLLVWVVFLKFAYKLLFGDYIRAKFQWKLAVTIIKQYLSFLLLPFFFGEDISCKVAVY